MKRIAAVLLALLLFSTACGDDTDSVSEGEPSEQADEPNAESSAEVAPEGDDDTVLEGEQDTSTTTTTTASQADETAADAAPKRSSKSRCG